MTDDELDRLIKEAVCRYGETFIDESTLDYTPHQFSRRFERRMNAMIRRGYVCTINRRLPLKRQIRNMWIVAFIAVMTVVITGAGIRAQNYFETHTSRSHSDIRYTLCSDSPADMSVEYKITKGMEDFTLTEEGKLIGENYYVYESPDYILYFTQYDKNGYDVAVNTEGYELEEIEVNLNHGFYVDMWKMGCTYLSWERGDYIFEISMDSRTSSRVNIDKDAQIEMAESVRLAE